MNAPSVIDITEYVHDIIERVNERGLDDDSWYIRVREGDDTRNREAVENIKGRQEAGLSAELAAVIRRRMNGPARFVWFEAMEKGGRSPFYTFTVELRPAKEHVEPTESGAMSALAGMAVGTNQLLHMIIRDLTASLVTSRENEMKAITILAELTGEARAGDNTARWEAMKDAAVALGPAFMVAAQAGMQWVQSQSETVRPEQVMAFFQSLTPEQREMFMDAVRQHFASNDEEGENDPDA